MSKKRIQTSPKNFAYQTIVEMIQSGKLLPSHRSPSERQLAEICNVARMTARSALVQLERDGYIQKNGNIRIINHVKGSWLLSSTIVILSQDSRNLRTTFFSGQEWFVQLSAMNEIENEGLHCLTLNPRISDSESFKSLLFERPRGILATYNAAESSIGQSFLSSQAHSGVPVVVYGNSESLSSFYRVASDHYKGGSDIVHWFASHGRKRLQRIWSFSEKPHWLQQRSAGCEDAMKKLGLEILPEFFIPSHPEDSETCLHNIRTTTGYLVELLKSPQPPDAIIAMTDGDAGLIASACTALGFDTNKDILISGYDNLWDQNHLKPYFKGKPAITVDKNNGKIGEALAKLICQISAPNFNPQTSDIPLCHIIPHKLVEL